MTDSKVCMLEMQSKLDKICNGMDVMQNKQEEMSQDIAKIKEAVYNPDEGLYARLRALEQWKENQSRVQWLVTSGVIMLILKMLWDTMMAGGAG